MPPTRPRGRLGRWLGRKPRSQPAAAPESELDALLAAGRQLRQLREERGLSLRQLALDTRVSAAVLEALQSAYELSTGTMKGRMEELTGGLNLNLPGLGG